MATETKLPPLTRAEVTALRKKLWRSFEGCECKGGPPSERCTVQWIRCNGRLARFYDDLEREQLPRIADRKGRT